MLNTNCIHISKYRPRWTGKKYSQIQILRFCVYMWFAYISCVINTFLPYINSNSFSLARPSSRHIPDTIAEHWSIAYVQIPSHIIRPYNSWPDITPWNLALSSLLDFITKHCGEGNGKPVCTEENDFGFVTKACICDGGRVVFKTTGDLKQFV